MSMNTTDVMPLYGAENIVGWFDSTFKALSRVITAGAIGTAAVTTTLSPSYAAQDFNNIPTYRVGYLESERKGYEISIHSPFGFLNSYKFQQNDAVSILSYVFNCPNAKNFLAEMSGLIEKIYPGFGDRKHLRLISDPDTDELLLEFVFDSGLPVDEEFFEKDRLLFKEIKDAGIESGLVNVIFVNA